MLGTHRSSGPMSVHRYPSTDSSLSFKRTLLAALCLSLLLGGWSGIQLNAVASNDAIDTDAIDDYIRARMRALVRIPGVALAVVKGDRIVYLKGYGSADSSGRAVTPQTPFVIGSIAKPFTALAVLQLMEAGKLQLDAPVQRYLPWFQVADRQASAQITVRHLLNQTSGIPQGPTLVTLTWPNDDDAIERHVRLLAGAQLNGHPGSSFTYANGNYVTLGAIVQSVSGVSYEDYIRQQIFAPLEMRHSYVAQEQAPQNSMAMLPAKG